MLTDTSLLVATVAIHSEETGGGVSAGIVRIPRSGGKPVPLVDNLEDPITTMAATRDTLYFITDDVVAMAESVRAVPLGASRNRQPADDSEAPRVWSGGNVMGLAAEPSSAYWLFLGTPEQTEMTLLRQSRGSDAVTDLAHAPEGGRGLAVQGGRAYWPTPSGIASASVNVRGKVVPRPAP